MTSPSEILVVGGGVIGASCAWHLAREGRKVRLLDPDRVPGAAWRASAGMLAAQIETDAGTPAFTLGIAGREFYREQADRLRSSTGIDIGWRELGILVTAATLAEAETLQARIAGHRQEGQPGEWLDGDRVRRTWPWLAPVIGAQHAPRDGVVDPVRLVAALRREAMLHGAEVIAESATAVLVENGRVRGVQGRDRHLGEHVVLAAGAWSGRITGVPRPLPVEPLRGQILTLPWPKEAPPAIVFGHGGYVLHRDAEAIVGSTMEPAGFAAEVTETGISLLRTRAEALVPAFRGVRVLRSWAGLRPGSPDGMPIVGPDPDVAGLWYATGHGRNGVLLAGVTGRIIADLLAGRATYEAAEAWRVGRFA